MDLSFLSGTFASPWDILRSLIDISIVAYVFYRILGLIRGTRAEQLLKGLVFLLVFSAIAIYLELEMVNWLVQKIWILFAITIPIVFQPELRRILEQLGRGSFFTSHRSTLLMEEYDTIIREISDAVSVLSRNQVGALIILTRETGIGEYMESGVNLDSLVSAGLLINIFVPNSPLHDGATVISGGRIEKSACFLPLSDNPSLDKELGTRHRAGIGITEVSDALSVIVSEETGAISIAREGKLQRYLDAQSLKEVLSRELVTQERWRDTFKRRWAGESEEKEHDRA
ncbi:MAG: diadenylate cyclase CdaA [Syntrophomonadaceae bacterium]|nr:diadenylate cyclase CdaA [Syntrophomonadaceae bacterium]MDD3890660.1 diadenylate cyclase CdaA [Syntrophomonadaceae bacterium]MDD4549111.1 diadenylate cyclase CdaA [Syntrophomonadaceae bacterium]